MDPLLEAFDPFVYRAKLVSVADGDTMKFMVDQGFDDRHLEDIRLREVDTDEIHTVSHDSDEFERGMDQLEFVEDWFGEAREEWDGDWPFVVDTRDEQGSFDRYLGYVYRRSDGEELNQALLDEYGERIEY